MPVFGIGQFVYLQSENYIKTSDMAGNKFNRYLWLINLLQTRGPIPYKEISKKWESSIYNDKPGVGLPLKTFHNHCGVIAEIFGVDVKCEEKSPYRYYIEQPAESEAWKFDMLNQLLLCFTIKDSPSLSDRVMNMDSPKEEMPLIMECIQKQGVISFIKPGHAFSKAGTLGERNRERIKNGKHYSNFLVLATVKVDFLWFVIGAFVEREKPFEEWRLSVFQIYQMKEIMVQYEAHCESAKTFSLQKYIDSFVFDPSDTFDDDRYSLNYYLTEFRERRERNKKSIFVHSVKEKQFSVRKIVKRIPDSTDK